MYLLGNPLVWWLNVVILLLVPIFLILQLICRQRSGWSGAAANDSAPLSRHLTAAAWLYLGWALHYLPFFYMERALFVHHYYPALVFSTCLTGVILDLSLRRLAVAAVRPPLMAAMTVLLIFSFRLFSPLVYGFRGDAAMFANSSYHHLYWLNTWQF